MTALALQTRLTAEQRDYLTTVKSSAESLLEIVNDILDFSKIEARRLELERVRVRSARGVGNAASCWPSAPRRRSSSWPATSLPTCPRPLLGDEGRLRQVLLNVIGNAVKFTSQGEVVLRVAVEQRGAVAWRRLHFTVTDTGIGIPAGEAGSRSSTRSPRPTARPRAATAAPASAWPSRCGSSS